ncbi:hypothetical protein GPLA_3283 [Paraglaciecola polaris LMG 21857]|uniref:Uncharacterized protein n=1 Tax=Paraglaciecola polaris LMG 21857 TaxID=1129793 RepID=K6ZZK2_9ALTE|nr:hypothetical protein GPLA_3283 [Paraglaciecola polaris LMG 21857]
MSDHNGSVDKIFDSLNEKPLNAQFFSINSRAIPESKPPDKTLICGTKLE